MNHTVVDVFRILGVAVVGLILVMPPGSYLDIMYDLNYQIAMGLIVVSSILFVDVIFGALLALAVLIWYFKMNYRRLVSTTLAGSGNQQARHPTIYGTPKNLTDAQTNVVDEKMMSTEMIGFDGVYGETVLGAQGLDKTLPGLEKKDSEPAPL